ncbi:MAG: phosphoadenosine phosphosulfate reductase family protein [Treponema sp.]|nr:phosphoadenosine phosphosulfate reductase family protein [Treponema sp.]
MAKKIGFENNTEAANLKFLSANIFYCHNCNIPIIQNFEENGNFCPFCTSKVEYLASDLRPVFPEERLLFELIKNRPLEFSQDSVWCANSRYYVNGKAINLATKELENANIEKIVLELKNYSEKNKKNNFTFYIQKFCEANKIRLKELTNEAFAFVQAVAKKTDEEHLVISFSGGKDSTVTADVVTRALSNPSIVHIFGDTTLEFETTLNYANRYRNAHPYAIFMTAKNEEQDFMEVADDIGPPARMMRWCCSMFKTGPISRILSNLFGDNAITTFYGIRKVESVSRSKYSRVTSGGEDVKIQKQTVASPIFYWKDIDIWLYLLSNDIDFNDAYRLGYDRVGCWCCPNNNTRAQFLSKIYMKEKADKWRNFLIDFAKRIGKQDAENYVDSGKWKARQGGNGLEAADDVKIKFTNCTTEGNAKIYQLNRPFDESLLNLFTPFGRVAPELGQKLIHETPVLDLKNNIQIISIQPFFKDGFTHAVKIKTMNVDKKTHETLQRQIGYQIRKFNSCRQCLKCEALCERGAITISAGGYHIDEKKCVHCRKCVSQKYLAGGCMMEKYLRTKLGEAK